MKINVTVNAYELCELNVVTFHFKNRADTQLYSGHFDIVQDDGRIVSINSDHQNALYHAVAQATGSKTEDPKKEAVMLRNKVKNEVSKLNLWL